MASPEEMAQAMIDNMKEKTGRSKEEWLPLVRASGLEKHGQILKWLKSEHSVTHGFASLIAHLALAEGQDAPSETDLVDAQYAGAKAGLRPIYDALVQATGEFGDDVEVSPKKTYVSLRRSKQFAILKPSTKTRFDLGINLGDAPETERLQPAGSMGMVSHKVALAEVGQVDAEVIGWLRQAYERA